MIRLFSSALFFGSCVFGVWWMWNHQPLFRNFVEERLETGKFLTLEARYTPDQIMETHRKDLLKNEQYGFLEPTLEFYPYALMEVKYSASDLSTAEGIILWGLEDGEMVVDTSNWMKTHGLEDCINNRADKSDFRVILALSRYNGSADRSKLLSYLHVENEVFDSMIDSCRKKKLIVQSGNNYRLHFQRPFVQLQPQTKLDQWLVTKPYKNATRISPRYSLSQIEDISYNLFTNDFSVRNIREIYLPVYCIVVQNPDGSHLTTYWNALNGKRFQHSLVPER